MNFRLPSPKVFSQKMAILYAMLVFSGIHSGFCQNSKLVKWKEIEILLADKTDTLSVINFWATWCKPCVAELPHFKAAEAQFAGRPVRFIYVSLDFAEDQKGRLDPFVNKRMTGSKVWLLDETDYNAWINKVDPAWSGAIPATVFVNNAKKIRKFVDGSLEQGKLFEIIEPLLQSQ
jgi:thiol-disulfide isomerase/thioredoxin